MSAFGREAIDRYGLDLDPDDYDDLWNWSVSNPDQFWAALWHHFRLGADTAYSQVLAHPAMPGKGWFAGATLNYAAQALRHGGDAEVALVSCGEGSPDVEITWGELRDQVACLGNWLRAEGVKPGDRVVGYLPNGAESVVGFLAAASVGAVWALCGPDLGVDGALSRLQQLQPSVLIAANAYVWNGVVHDRRQHIRDLREGLPSVRVTVIVEHVRPDKLGRADEAESLGPERDDAVPWASVMTGPSDLVIEPVASEHPLWVLFTSGTSGPPKGIVHSHVGVVLEHLKQLGLHLDLRPGERFFWYTSTNWMMWNLQVSVLLLGATAVLYDGSPAAPSSGRLWGVASRTGAAVFGTSPGHLVACEQAQLHPARDNDLSSLRLLGVTGAPVSEQTFEWCFRELGGDIQVSSAAGGTDVASAFATSNPLTPVLPGECSRPALGVALASWDEDGRALVDAVGELVVTSPMPSMPLYFWGDPSGERYHSAYFSHFAGVWRHGDWVEITPAGGVRFLGRSDSTLNRNGVRLGSADIYAAVERVDGVLDLLVVGVELSDGGYWMPLFVELADGVALDSQLRSVITTAILTHASPRHLPDEIILAPGVPRTKTGKRLEIPIKRLLQGARTADVVDLAAVDRPELFDFFAEVARSAVADP